jgi:hypothetical protein
MVVMTHEGARYKGEDVVGVAGAGAGALHVPTRRSTYLNQTIWNILLTCDKKEGIEVIDLPSYM